MRFPAHIDNQVIGHFPATATRESTSFVIAAFLNVSDARDHMRREHELGGRCTLAFDGFVTNLNHETSVSDMLDVRRVIEGRGRVPARVAA
jgi:hypothetical protein